MICATGTRSASATFARLWSTVISDAPRSRASRTSAASTSITPASSTSWNWIVGAFWSSTRTSRPRRPRVRRRGSDESLIACSSRSTPSCSSIVPLTNPVATRSATRPSISALVSMTCRSPRRRRPTRAASCRPSRRCPRAWPRPSRKPSDPQHQVDEHDRGPRRRGGHEQERDHEQRGRRPGRSRSPTTPPASCGAGLRRSSRSMPLTARSVSRPTPHRSRTRGGTQEDEQRGPCSVLSAGARCAPIW